MKLIYGGVPYNTTKVRHYEVSTNDATVEPTAVQAGLTYYANGRKEVGTGKSFEFASYGQFETNESDYVPSNINIIHISSLEAPVQLTIALNHMKNQDFSTPLEVGNVYIDNVLYPIFVSVNDNFITITCEQTVVLQVFYGKDNYV